MTLQLIDDAVRDGARRTEAAAILGIDARTAERWRAGKLEDLRRGPLTPPANKLSSDERQELLDTLTGPELRDLGPNQVVARLADENRYLASESTMYRVLRAENQLGHRGRAKAPVRRPPNSHTATGPNQVWSWDITYLKSPIRGQFFYLYMMMDIWSRKVVGWAVHDVESAHHAARLLEAACPDAKNPQSSTRTTEDR